MVIILESNFGTFRWIGRDSCDRFMWCQIRRVPVPEKKNPDKDQGASQEMNVMRTCIYIYIPATAFHFNRIPLACLKNFLCYLIVVCWMYA